MTKNSYIVASVNCGRIGTRVPILLYDNLPSPNPPAHVPIIL